MDLEEILYKSWKLLYVNFCDILYQFRDNAERNMETVIVKEFFRNLAQFFRKVLNKFQLSLGQLRVTYIYTYFLSNIN